MTELPPEFYPELVQGAGYFHGPLTVVAADIGYTPRLLDGDIDEIESMTDAQMAELFTEQDPVRLIDDSTYARALLVPVPGEDVSLVIEQSVQFCADCKEAWPSFYMVHDHLWEKHASNVQLLCVDCLEKRVGRTLTCEDLNNALLNDTDLVREMFTGRSEA